MGKINPIWAYFSDGLVNSTANSEGIHGYIRRFKKQTNKQILGGGFKYFLFSPYLGKIPVLTNIFQMGWNHQPE